MASIGEPVPHHKPVLLQEIIDVLHPRNMRVFVDCTVGEGGHLEAVLDVMPSSGTAVGLDRDSEVVETTKKRLERFGDRVRLFTGSYTEVGEVLKMIGKDQVDGFLFDLGLSSYQLAMPRGFAFSSDSPLDMRFDRDEDVPTAAELINSMPEAGIRDVLRSFGEERKAGRIAKGIVAARRSERIETTRQLSDVVEKAVGRRGRIHPATRAFQALRIYVNSELEHVRSAMESVPGYLAPGGRVAVISYHSMEDRIVKQAMRKWESEELCTILTKKPVTPGKDELRKNPRSRSGKLRVSERRM